MITPDFLPLAPAAVRHVPPAPRTMPESPPDQQPAAGQLGALVVAVLAAAASGLYHPPGPVPPRWSPLAVTATAAVRAAGTATASAVAATRTAAARPTATATPSATPAIAGAAEAPVAIDPPAPYFTFRWPFDGTRPWRASRYYPYGTDAAGAYLLHHGVDIGDAFGVPVLAAGDGEVVYGGPDTGEQRWGPEPDFYGQVVVVRHAETVGGRPLFSLYGHVSEVKARAGDRVRRGDTIALTGSGGVAMGPHLHLEFRVGAAGPALADYEQTRNPELFLANRDGRGTIIGRVAGPDGANRPGIVLGLYAVDAAGREQWIGQTTTYPARHVNPSEAWGENFVFADTPPGRYVVATSARGPGTRVVVTLESGQVVGVTLRVGP